MCLAKVLGLYKSYSAYREHRCTVYRLSVVACDLQVTYDTHLSVDIHMQGMLDEAYCLVKEMLERNRAALDMLIQSLIQATEQQLDGSEVRDIIEKNGNSEDLQLREQNQTVFA